MKKLFTLLIALTAWKTVIPAGQSLPPAPVANSSEPVGIETTPMPGENFQSQPRPATVPSGTSSATKALPGGSQGRQNYWIAPVREADRSVSVIAFKSPNQQTVDETAEDLNIMSLVLAQNLERTFANDTSEFKLGIPMLLKSGARWVEASYIEGFGAVFNLKVRFPLVAPKSPVRTVEETPRVSEWDRARSSLVGTAEPALEDYYKTRMGLVAAQDWRVTSTDREQPFDPALIETLRTRVLELLRNASNLRHVAPEEFVVVTFSGPPNTQFVTSAIAAGSKQSAAGVMPVPEPYFPAPADSSREQTQNPFRSDLKSGRGQGHIAEVANFPERLTFMSIRIKKSKAEAFAANKLPKEDFLKSAEVTTYLGPLVTGSESGGLVRMR